MVGRRSGFLFGARWLLRRFCAVKLQGLFDVMWRLMPIGTTTFSRPSERAPNAAYSKTISEAQDWAEFSCACRKIEPHIYTLYSSPSFLRISQGDPFTLIVACFCLKIFFQILQAFNGPLNYQIHFVTSMILSDHSHFWNFRGVWKMEDECFGILTMCFTLQSFWLSFASEEKNDLPLAKAQRSHAHSSQSWKWCRYLVCR